MPKSSTGVIGIFCPHCRALISTEYVAQALGRKGGRSKSEAKQNAARENGWKGGAPKKNA